MRFLVLGRSSASGAAFLDMLRLRVPTCPALSLSRNDVFDEPSETTPHATMVAKLRKHLDDFQPTHIINFLGSFSNILTTDLQANVVLPHALLEAIQLSAPSSSVVLIGSAAEYGRPLDERAPVAETHPCSPLSIYGATKQMQSIVAAFFSHKFSLNVKVARTFNIQAPGLSDRLFVGRMYRQIEEFCRGERTAIECGPLTDVRDYLPMSRVIDDYMRILCTGVRGEVYNVCSGHPISMRELLTDILREAQLETIPVEVNEKFPLSPVPKIFGAREKLDALPPLSAVFDDVDRNWT